MFLPPVWLARWVCAVPVNSFFFCCSLPCPVLYQDSVSILSRFLIASYLKVYVPSYSTRLSRNNSNAIHCRGCDGVPPLLSLRRLNSYSYSINYTTTNFPISNLIFFFCLFSFLPFYFIRRWCCCHHYLHHHQDDTIIIMNINYTRINTRLCHYLVS